MYRNSVLLACSTALIFPAAMSSAASLVGYDFVGASTAQSSGVLTGSSVSLNGGAAVRSGQTGYVEFSTGRTANSLSNSIAANDYVGFTLTNNLSGRGAVLDTITLDWGFNSPNQVAPPFYSLHTLGSRNGSFSTANQLDSLTLSKTGPDRVQLYEGLANARPTTFDVSSLGTIQSGESIEFRVYFSDNRDQFSPDHLVDNVSVNGTIAKTTSVAASEDLAVRRNGNVEPNPHVKNSNNNSVDRFGLFRFDTDALQNEILDAALEFSSRSGTAWQGEYTFNVWGVLDGDLQDEAFTEASYDPNAPGALFDGSGDLIHNAQVVNLGSFDLGANSTANFTSQALIDFLRNDTNGIASFALTRNVGNGGNSVFENNGSARPATLTLQTIPSPTAALAGLVGLGSLCLRRRR